ncbi:hypothetical protein MSAN_02271200 [Mycena sanguinolenta]|uniref:Uncharacterized protein n=1 Tax=Mycena sanguinolenta TaxID=230812 RepID=A0A8H6XAY9_9AGAR|nr:hypothetical protein MSAN_02271200 [Mycena sanguinolenta]
MEPQAESDPEFSFVSMNNAEWDSYAGGFWPKATPSFLSTLATMDLQAESDPEFSAVSTNSTEWASYAGAFWLQANPVFPSTLTTMDFQAESEPEFSLVSTNNVERDSYNSALLPQSLVLCRRITLNGTPLHAAMLAPSGPKPVLSLLPPPPQCTPQAESNPEFSAVSTNNAEQAFYACDLWPQASGAFAHSVINHYHITGASKCMRKIPIVYLIAAQEALVVMVETLETRGLVVVEALGMVPL